MQNNPGLTPKMVADAMQYQPDKVLVVLDGLDEYHWTIPAVSEKHALCEYASFHSNVLAAGSAFILTPNVANYVCIPVHKLPCKHFILANL